MLAITVSARPVSTLASAGDEATTAGAVTLGRYELRLRLATGGMASVYLAKARGHAAFEKWVAVKVINPQLALDRTFVRMFLDEARLVAKLNHSNICSVLDFGTAENTYFRAMEYLHGESLSTVNRHVQKHGGMPNGVAARIVADAARGLHAAHELKLPDGTLANVVHRDVSPQNIFVLYDGVTKVVDFGIAKSVDRTSERTSTGIIKGKLSYMAPEQLRNGEPDRRIDIFALGIVLWEITTGKRLFQREHEAATMCAVLQDPIPSPASVRANYPAALAEIVLRALDRDPEQRYQTAAEFARELDRFVVTTGQPAGAEEVATLMHAQFAKKIAARDKLLNESSPGVPTDLEGHPVRDPLALYPESIVPPEAVDSDGARRFAEPSSAVGRKPTVPPQTGVLDGSASREAVPVVVVEGRSKNRAIVIGVTVFAIPLLLLAGWLATRAPEQPRRTIIYAGPQTQTTTVPTLSAQATQTPVQVPPTPRTEPTPSVSAVPAAGSTVAAPVVAPPSVAPAVAVIVREPNPRAARRLPEHGATSNGATNTGTATTPVESHTARPHTGPRPATDFNQL